MKAAVVRRFAVASLGLVVLAAVAFAPREARSLAVVLCRVTVLARGCNAAGERALSLRNPVRFTRACRTHPGGGGGLSVRENFPAGRSMQRPPRRLPAGSELEVVLTRPSHERVAWAVARTTGERCGGDDVYRFEPRVAAGRYLLEDAVLVLE